MARSTSHLAFLGREHRYLDLGADVGRLLDAALQRGTRPALDAFGPEHRTAAAGCLAHAVDAGLLVAG